MLNDVESPGFLTVKEVARAWRVHEETVYRAIWGGRLFATRLGETGSWRIPRSELEARLRPVATEGER